MKRFFFLFEGTHDRKYVTFRYEFTAWDFDLFFIFYEFQLTYELSFNVDIYIFVCICTFLLNLLVHTQFIN